MNEPKWVLEDVVKALHGMLLSEHGGGEGVRDITLLESALNRAPQKFTYDNNATIFDLAAAYSFGIAKNHPFVDGNKRTAFTVGVIFLEINDYKFIASETESTVIFEGLAGSQISEPELSTWFEQNSELA
ncbi:MAG: type II toxin-antitoxin system death-on-curing family toxin [Alteromonadaceae bacterium]|nr:MAG: type II toxin-antitoxin system death-on-curing family toxin [Alteromonadaceae bacterium]